ncbi:hypothetical protein [Pseudomonas nabeulensis]|uniref:hypothetical protein n=1 Tax=Pseudomonas nabeulensis TaxID=2293833 RepID=UPI00142EC92A|nr:hypothetical protein [Pseudomonas nabeulensis]
MALNKASRETDVRNGRAGVSLPIQYQALEEWEGDVCFTVSGTNDKRLVPF